MIETPDLFNNIWTERPEVPRNEIFELPKMYSGLSRREKRELVLSGINKYNADLHIITATD
jgi:Xaa-Pro aminopeptidase